MQLIRVAPETGYIGHVYGRLRSSADVWSTASLILMWGIGTRRAWPPRATQWLAGCGHGVVQ